MAIYQVQEEDALVVNDDAIKIVASQAEPGRQSISTHDVSAFASRALSWVSSVCNGQTSCSTLMGFGRGEG